MPLSCLKIEHVEEIADRRHVVRNIGVILMDRVGQIIPTALRQWLQQPVSFNELQHGGMVGIAVYHFTATRVFGHNDKRDTRPIAKEVDRLEEAGSPVPTTLVEGDEERSLIEKPRVCLEFVQDSVNQGFKDIELGGRGMAIPEAVGF